MSNNTQFETLQFGAVGQIEPTTKSLAVPIYQINSYGFHRSKHTANHFGLEDFSNIYTGLIDAEKDVFEKRMEALKGGAFLTTGSGQVA
jgi:O-acetylhomoserine/O-acetylserine sulfhydrylase-like pyridoxal-dependent enzyme